MKKLLIVAGVLALTGCASKPLPMATQDTYDVAGVRMYLSQACVEKGLFSPEIGARTAQYTMADINRYFRYYPETLQANIEKLSKHTDADYVKACARVAIETVGRYNQIQQNNAWQAEQKQELNRTLDSINNSRPIYCNTVGTMTLCN